MERILLVEDDCALAMGLVYSIQQEGFEVTHCPDAKSAREAFASSPFDLALLDVMLPDGNGFDLCRQFHSSCPVILLTACDEEVNVVMGLDGGADDYITKPFRVRELISRMRAVLRRCKSTDDTLKAGALTLHPEHSCVTLKGQSIPLTAMELRLLSHLMRNKGQTLTRTQLLDKLWDNRGEFVDDNTLSVNIRRLREKLEENPNQPQTILTVRGVGYRLEASE
ncbi:response regulator transcription factor [[Clostridium] leptum]|nr:response regulator transcription factor [[Clostridium] leptum]